MKKIFKSIALVAVAAASLVSCNKEVKPVDPVEKEYTYTFSLSNQDTKAYLDLGDAVTKWESGDQLGVYTVGTPGTSWNKFADIDASETPVVFQINSHYALSAGDKVFCYFPYDANNSNGDARNPTKVNLSIPTSQNGKMNAMPMVSVPYTMTASVASQTEKPISDINMRNLGGIFQFNIFSTVAEYQSETIKSVEFNANAAIAGSFVYDITQEELSAMSDYTETAVTVEGQNLAIADNKNDASKVLMVVAPGTHSGSLVVTTDVAIYTLNFSSAKTVERSHVKPLNVDLKNASRKVIEVPTYELVTSLADITEGEYIIASYYSDAEFIVPNAEASAGGVLSKKYSDSSLEVGNDVLTGDATGYNWTFTGTNTAMTIKSVAVPADYLYATNANNGIVVGKTADTWGFTVTEGGFYMKDTTNNRYFSQYNKSNWRCYTGTSVTNGTAVIKLYKLHDETPAITAESIEVEDENETIDELALTFRNFAEAPTDLTVVSKSAFVGDCSFSNITAEGATLEYEIENNYSTSVRNGSIVVSANGAQVTIAVSQPASVFSVTADDPVIIENTAESTGSFTIKSSFAGTLVLSDTENFICNETYDANKTDGVEIEIVAVNDGASTTREATVTVKREGLDDVVVNIRQNKAGATQLDPVTGISVTNASTSGFRASWTSNANADSYNWVLSTESSISAALEDANKHSGNVNTAALDFSEVLRAGNYYLYVQAVGDGTVYSDSDYASSAQFEVTSLNEVEFTASNDFNSNNYSTGVTKSSVTATFAKGSGSSFSYYSPIRFYSKNTLTISSSNTIRKVVITFGTAKNLSASVGTYDSNTKTWTGSATSVTLTNAESAQATITSFKVWYEFDPLKPTLELNPNPATKEWESSETDSYVVNVLATNGSWNISPTSLSWATVVADKSENTITITPNGTNTSTSADNTGTITVTHANDPELTATISLTQKKQSQKSWKQVTNASSIKAGDQVVFVYVSGTTKKELTGINNNIGTATDFTTAPNASYILTVENGSSEGSFSFKNGSDYLSYSGSSNNIATSTSKTASSSWTVSISDGKATITNKNSTTRVIKYNTSSPRFCCYTSGQQLIQIYRYE